MTRHEQTYLPGTEPPHHNPDIERSLDAWLDAKDEQRTAGETTRLRHATLLTHMANVGCDAYPYLDRRTGKKKQVVITREPKAKTTRAPTRNRRDDDGDIGQEVTPEEAAEKKAAKKAKAEADRVETRRVPRASVETEIDPFASTRAGLLERAAKAQDDAPADSGTPLAASIGERDKAKKRDRKKSGKGRRS